MNDRVEVLKDWIAKEGRKQTWIAQQVGYSPQWLNYILKRKKPMSDKLARALRDKLGIPLIGEEPAIRNGYKKKAGLKTQKGVGGSRCILLDHSDHGGMNKVYVRRSIGELFLAALAIADRPTGSRHALSG